MSPLALGSLISAIIFTAAKISLTIADLAAGKPLVAIQLGGCVTIGATVSWTAFFTAYCRDTGIAKATSHSSQLRDSVNDHVENLVDERFHQLSTEVHLANRARNADHDKGYGVPTPPPRRPHLVP